jgi:sRNA-binding protein
MGSVNRIKAFFASKFDKHVMNIDKKWLNKLLRETLSTQYEIEKFLKTRAKEKNISPGYHIIYTAPESGEQSILTSEPLGVNLQQAKAGLENWLAVNPTPKKSAPSKPSAEKTPENLSNQQKRYLRLNAAFEFLCATFPKCFVPRGSSEPIRAFAVGFRNKLFEAVKDRLPEGMSRDDIRRALWVYCHSFKYNAAKSKEGNLRINLEGEVVGSVTAEEVKLFLDSRKKSRKSTLKRPSKEGEKSVQKKIPVAVVNNKEVTFPPKRPILKLKKSGVPNNQSARISVQSLKITLPLKPEQVSREILPKVGTPGTAKMKVFWDLVLAGQEKQVFRVGFSVKNYRKCLNTLEQHEGSECIVLLQGKLVNGGVIESAGLSVQVPKG